MMRAKVETAATGRTTVTLDADVRRLLVEASHRQGKPFKATLNDAIRAGLDPRRGAAPEALDLPTFDMGAPLVDLTKAAALADELADRKAINAAASPQPLQLSPKPAV